MQSYKIKLRGINCLACVKLATIDLENINGIQKVDIDESGNGTIDCERELTADEIAGVLGDKSYSLGEFKKD